MSKRSWILIAFVLMVIYACVDGNNPLKKVNNYDQSLLLNNLGDNLIYPSYQELRSKTQQLERLVNDFVQSPSVASLDSARLALKDARMAYQWVSPYQFGPADQLTLNAELNLYPVDINQIENNILSGNYDLGVLTNQDARGFQTIAYLIHGNEITDEEIIASLDPNRSNYLKDVVSRISQFVNQVEMMWSPAGEDYLSKFKDMTGVDVGSSVGMLVNAMSQNFERNTRDGKIGIPIGIRTLGEAIPENVEAPYAGYSTELFQENLSAYQAIYEGISLNGSESEGFDDYLSEIEALDASNQDLHQTISSQWETIIGHANQFSDPLELEIITRQSDLENLFAEMQRMVVYMKTDMSSALGVIISYQDNDGD